MASENNMAVLLMSYGSPTRMEDVRAYLEDIYEGEDVPEYAIRENMEKYAMVNGVSPSNAIIDTLIHKLIRSLGSGFSVYLGNKHWKPKIQDVLNNIRDEGDEKILAIPLFPFPSVNVRDSYYIPLKESLRGMQWEPSVQFVNGFWEERGFQETWNEILKPFQEQDAYFLFDAHSLPTFRHPEPEYDASFRSASENIAVSAGLKKWTVGYQSRGKYGSSWLEPSIYDVAKSIVKDGGSDSIVTVPVGFCYEHLEVLYDLDHEFGETLKTMGAKYMRTPLPNYMDPWVEMFSEIIRRRSIDF